MRRLSKSSKLLAAVAVALFLAACRGGAVESAVPSAMPALSANKPAGKIKHVIIIVQENRSFNNLFYGYPGAKTASYGFDTSGKKIVLKPVGLETTWDLQHNAKGFIAACNGTGKIPGTNCRMNGFDNETWTCTPGKAVVPTSKLEPDAGETPCPNSNPPYSYVPHNEIKPYFDLAGQYVLADEMYASDYDSSSFISHQYIITGQNPESAVDYPNGSWGCTGAPGDVIGILGADRKLPTPGKKSDYEYPCWNPKTLGDELDAASLGWAFYAVPVSGNDALQPDSGSSRGRGIWSAYQGIEHVYDGPDWSQDVFSPPSKFLNDIGRGNLRSVTWITPTYANSDHGGSGSSTGPSWVASLVNAVGESQFWDSSAIFIFWDDYGGWFDPQKPTYVDNDGLGARLPLLIVSPYAKRGRVSHVHYEHGSILKFVEEQFGLAPLAASDKRAKSPAPDCFDFSQPPRKFVPIQSPHGATYFRDEPLDARDPDAD